MTPKEEATILRKIATALRAGWIPGYVSMGGPQDGDSVPDGFDPHKSADNLEDEADRLEKSS